MPLAQRRILKLQKQAGIECKRGVVVDEYLQTNDPNIFAIGEIAEFKGFLYGITAAAEQQAEIVARYLNGDISKYYDRFITDEYSKNAWHRSLFIGRGGMP